MQSETNPSPVKMMMKPTMGRIVHYVEDGHIFPAMIVHIDSQWEVVNLIFWNKWGEQMFRKDVFSTQDPSAANKSWFWPMIQSPSLEDIRKLGEQVRNEIIKMKPPEVKK